MNSPNDSHVRCDKCGREERANFAGSLRSGWPKCCGYTMRLLRTEADIAAAVGSIFDDARKSIEHEASR